MWDSIFRIVPHNYAPNESREIREATEAGLIRNVVLEAEDLQETRGKFQDFLDSLDAIPDGLYHGNSYERVHVDKIDQRLYPVLEQLSARIAGDWIEMPDRLARGYMLYLAREVGRRRALSLATDSPDAWVAASFINEDGNFSEYVPNEAAPGQYCCIGFRHLLPLDAAHVPMREIIRLSVESARDKREFRKTATDFISHLSACQSEEHAHQLANEFRDSLSERMSVLRARMGFWKAGVPAAVLAVGVPTSLTALSTLLTIGQSAGAPALFASLSIGFVAALASHEQTRQKRPEDRIAAYLLSADDARTDPPHLGYLMNEFIND